MALKKRMFEKIQLLKRMGIPPMEAYKRLKRDGIAISKPTFLKYYHMASDQYLGTQNYAKHYVFADEPYQTAILTMLEATRKRKKVCVSSLYDVLRDKFGELPGSEQTLRKYIKHLKGVGAFSEEVNHERTYCPVPTQAPGQKLQIDFGQEKIDSHETVHFLVAVLMHSRFKACVVQDHPFNSSEACSALVDIFWQIGGRVQTLVLDQDHLFISSEDLGRIIETECFKQFLAEQEIRLWLCRKNDPESKGMIESLVKFVKLNFFSGRVLTSFSEVQEQLARWLYRKNHDISRATYQIPADVLEEIEKDHLRPLVSSIFSTLGSDYVTVEIKDTQVVKYKSNMYSVPYHYCFRQVKYRAVGGLLYIYDAETMQLIDAPQISPLKGRKFIKDEHKRPTVLAVERLKQTLKAEFNSYSLAHYLNGVVRANERYAKDQLEELLRFLRKEHPSHLLYEEALKQCCTNQHYHVRDLETIIGDLSHAPAPSKPSHTFSMKDSEGRTVTVRKQPSEYWDSVFRQKTGQR